MNKKVLVIAVALMAVAMLATPLFGTRALRTLIFHHTPDGR
jgi:hypothetical protein